MRESSELFKRCQKTANIDERHFYQSFEPDLTTEYDTGDKYLDNNQDVFEAKLEDWILKNEKFLVLYIKLRAFEEREKAQEKFKFVKDL